MSFNEDIQSSVKAPLIARGTDEPIALILKPLAPLPGVTGTVTGQQFLQHVHCLAGLLPDCQYAINLCENRYLFIVAFCASVLKQQTSLLPPNKKMMTQVRLRERYDDVYIIHDDLSAGVDDSFPSVEASHLSAEVSPPNIEDFHPSDNSFAGADIPVFNLSTANLTAVSGSQVCPSIALDHVAAISFTSGSTGDSKPNYKNWRTLIESSRINAKHMLVGFQETMYQLATVPPQHMWGLETSVLLPLFESVCVADIKPLFPLDIQHALQSLPSPRLLVTAPVHLRALCMSNLEYPDISLVLCATSPLSQALASEVEQLFSAELREVYGCSEIGSMAVRNTGSSQPWRLFDGIHWVQQDDGTNIASTDYLPSPVIIQDRVEMLEGRYFNLKGRATDMVDVAGKRGSLLEINQVLLNFPGIVDGVVFMPDHAEPLNENHSENKKPYRVTRLAALVVLSDAIKSEDIRKYLRQHFDNAFIPRPIIRVDALPREENGKLPTKNLQRYYKELISRI